MSVADSALRLASLKKPSALPGFGLALGCALVYLALMCLAAVIDRVVFP